MSLKALLTRELIVGLRISNAILRRSYANGSGALKNEPIDITSVDTRPIYEQTLIEEDIDAEMELKRNKSRLNPQDHRILNGERPYDKPVAYHHYGLTFKRRMLGRYGIKGSGVPPGLAWPTKENIAMTKEYEKVAYPLSLKESWAQLAEKRAAEEAAIRARDADLAAKSAKTAQWEKELYAKLAKKEAEAQVARERKERLVEEVRRHFGFKVDPRDEKFKEMMDQKEQEERKRQKAEKKKAKQEQFMAKLLDGSLDGVLGESVATKLKANMTKNSK